MVKQIGKTGTIDFPNNVPKYEIEAMKNVDYYIARLLSNQHLLHNDNTTIKLVAPRGYKMKYLKEELSGIFQNTNLYGVPVSNAPVFNNRMRLPAPQFGNMRNTIFPSSQFSNMGVGRGLPKPSFSMPQPESFVANKPGRFSGRIK